MPERIIKRRTFHFILIYFFSFFRMYQHNAKQSSLLFTYLKTLLDYHKFDQILKAFVIKMYVVYLEDSQKEAYQIKMLNYNFLYKLSVQSREAHHQNSSHLNHAYLNIFMYRLTKNLLLHYIAFSEARVSHCLAVVGLCRRSEP